MNFFAENKQSVILTFSLSGLLLLLTVLLYFFVFPPEVPLFYSQARPQDWLAPKPWLFLLPGLSFFLSIIQLFFLRWFKSETEIAKTIGWSTSFFVCLLFLAFIRITFLVI